MKPMKYFDVFRPFANNRFATNMASLIDYNLEPLMKKMTLLNGHVETLLETTGYDGPGFELMINNTFGEDCNAFVAIDNHLDLHLVLDPDTLMLNDDHFLTMLVSHEFAHVYVMHRNDEIGFNNRRHSHGHPMYIDIARKLGTHAFRKGETLMESKNIEFRLECDSGCNFWARADPRRIRCIRHDRRLFPSDYRIETVPEMVLDRDFD